MIVDLLKFNVSLDYFKIFYVVAKEGNLTKASQKLYISQPAVTQTIGKLEQKLGEKLFLRDNKGIVLTRVGQEVFESVEKGLLAFGQISDKLNKQKKLEEGQLNIGTGSFIAKELLTQPIKRFTKSFSNIKIKMVDADRQTFLSMLSAGELDLVIGQKSNLDTSKFEFVSLLKEKSVFVASSSFVFDKKLPIELLLKDNLIVLSEGTSSRNVLEELGKKHELEIFPKIEVTGHGVILELVLQGLGIGFLPYYLAKPHLDSRNLVLIKPSFEMPEYEYGLLLNKFYISKVAEEFCRFLKK